MRIRVAYRVSVVFSIQNWLGESEDTTKNTSTPGYFTIGMSRKFYHLTPLPRSEEERSRGGGDDADEGMRTNSNGSRCDLPSHVLAATAQHSGRNRDWRTGACSTCRSIKKL